MKRSTSSKPDQWTHPRQSRPNDWGHGLEQERRGWWIVWAMMGLTAAVLVFAGLMAELPELGA